MIFLNGFPPVKYGIMFFFFFFFFAMTSLSFGFLKGYTQFVLNKNPILFDFCCCGAQLSAKVSVFLMQTVNCICSLNSTKLIL